MLIVSVPPRWQPPHPWPPRRTIFLRPGTMAENDGARWVLRRDEDMYGSWKWWELVEGTKQ